MEGCKNKATGKYFIFIEEVGDGMLLLILPDGDLKSLDSSLFDDIEELVIDNCQNTGLITTQQFDKYKKIIKEDSGKSFHNSVISADNIDSACIICGENCINCEILSNGRFYHMECYNRILERINRTNEILIDAKRVIQKNKKAIDQTHTIIYKIKTFFGGYKTDIGKLTSEISTFQEEITILNNKIGHDTKIITRLYDYWLDRPPDWDERRDAVIENACYCCERCDRDYGEKHVHHIFPISKGGSHRFDNLIYLCLKCHSRAHGKRNVSIGGGKILKDAKSPYARRLDLINKAIINNERILFQYRKFEGEKSVRTISPKYIKQKGRSLCIVGFCYLRNAERVFAIKRMSRVKIVDSDDFKK